MNKFFRTYTQGPNNFNYFVHGVSQFSLADRWIKLQYLSFSFCKCQEQCQQCPKYKELWGQMRWHQESCLFFPGEKHQRHSPPSCIWCCYVEAWWQSRGQSRWVSDSHLEWNTLSSSSACSNNGFSHRPRDSTLSVIHTSFPNYT